MNERIAVYSCKTGDLMIRERTDEEQSIVNAERVATAKREASKAPTLEARVKAIEDQLNANR